MSDIKIGQPSEPGEYDAGMRVLRPGHLKATKPA